MRTKRLTAALVFLSALGIAAPAQAQRKAVYGSNTVWTNSDGTRFVIPTTMLQGAQFYNSAKIAQQDMRSTNPASAEVKQYLSNTAAWQKNVMAPQHAVELGVPTHKVVLRNGIILDEWAIPPLPPGTTKMHRFTLGPSELPPGYNTKTWETSSYVYQLWTPPGMPLPQFLPSDSFQGFK